MSIEVLILGAHPDDVECGVGGLAALMGIQRIPFAVVDMTRGEAGSRGTPEQRLEEALVSSQFLGACSRENLDMGDGLLEDSVRNRQRVATVIRKYRPQIVLAPYWEDLHNDHAAAGMIVRHSSIYCSMAKFESPYPPHKPRLFLYYLLHHCQSPTFVVDISKVFDRKIEAIKKYTSQFEKNAEQYGVIPVGIGNYLFHIESRSRYFGSLANFSYGEPFMADGPIAMRELTSLITLIS
jgi:bacillithiol biosynthesis deacetylase BshB1